MKTFVYRFFVALSLMLVITGEVYAAKASGVAYVSSSTGNDGSDGRSMTSPLKSISKAVSIADTLYLKAGDTFYGAVDFKTKVVDRYGKGADPVICGFRYIVRPNWEKVGENLWHISLKDDCYEGVDDSSNSRVNNVGCIYDCKADVVYGCKLQEKDKLAEDWDYWQTSSFATSEVNDSTFNELFLYLSKDPNDMQLAFSSGTSGVKLNNGSLSNVKIMGFGIHGITGGSKATVRNCTIDVIGGSIQVGYSKYTRLGNGIEFYVSSNITGSLVEGCTISRCYDCGVTIQGSGKEQAKPSDITIRRNYIHDCCQGWEDFLRNGETDLFENCVLSENLLVDNGSKVAFGYGDGRFKYCQVLGNNTMGVRGMIIRENVFINGNYYCSGLYNKEYKSNVWEGNVCYIQRGQFILSNYTGTKDVIRIPTESGDFASLDEATADAISRYRKLTGDETTEFVIIEAKDKEGLVKKFKKEMLGK